MSKGNKVRIEQEGFNVTKIFIDGIELRGVKEVEYRNELGGFPIITVAFTPETLNYDKLIERKSTPRRYR